MGTVKFKTWPDEEVFEADAADVLEVRRGETPDESKLVLGNGAVVIVLHSPREVQRILRDSDRPRLDADDVIKAVWAELEERRPGATLSDEDEIMLEVLVRKINEALSALHK